MTYFENTGISGSHEISFRSEKVKI
jgi:hypothetical protein